MSPSDAIAIAESNLARASAERFARNKKILWVYPPFWAEADDMHYFEEYEFLLHHGQVVWGVVVQANKYLWKPSDVMAGATVIYSLNARDDYSLKRLMETSSRLFALKKSPIPSEPQECAYRAMLIDEMDRAHGMRVPPTLSDGLEAINTTVLFPRSHMDGNMLALKHFPLLVHPEKLSAVMVPSIFWGDEFKAAWRSQIHPAPSNETERLFAPSGAWRKFRISMGSALHPKNIFWLVMSIFIIALTSPNFLYQLDQSPIVVQSIEELHATPADEFVEFTVPLQLNQKLINRRSRKDYAVIPLAGTNHSAFAYRRQSEHEASNYAKDQPRSQPEVIRGRLYRERSKTDWRAGFERYFVRGMYRRHDIKVPADFLVIDESKRPSYLRALLLGGLMLLMLIFPVGLIIRIYRTHRIFRHDDRELLSKLWWQRECTAETDPEYYDE